MSFLFFLFIAVLPAQSNEIKPVELAYMHYQDKTSEHQYWIEKTAQGKMRLNFKDGQKPIQTKLIPEGQATLFFQKITKAYWDSQFKNPVKAPDCSVYARVRVLGEKIAPVCIQHGKDSGWLYGTFVEMRSFFR